MKRTKPNAPDFLMLAFVCWIVFPLLCIFPYSSRFYKDADKWIDKLLEGNYWDD